MPDQRPLDPDGTRVALTLKQMVMLVGALIACSVTIVGYFVVRDIRTEHAFERIQTTVQTESRARSAENESLRVAINEVRDAVKQLVVDTVSVRQSQVWLDLFQITLTAWVDRLRADNPSLKVGDIKVPPLPR